LQRMGFTVTTCNDPIQALERFRADRGVWDLLVTDQVMPGMLGIEIIRNVKAERPSLPCLLMSGYTDDPSIGQAGSGDADVVLSKPFTPKTLVEALQKLMVPGSGR